MITGVTQNCSSFGAFPTPTPEFFQTKNGQRRFQMTWLISDSILKSLRIRFQKCRKILKAFFWVVGVWLRCVLIIWIIDVGGTPLLGSLVLDLNDAKTSNCLKIDHWKNGPMPHIEKHEAAKSSLPKIDGKFERFLCGIIRLILCLVPCSLSQQLTKNTRSNGGRCAMQQRDSGNSSIGLDQAILDCLGLL